VATGKQDSWWPFKGNFYLKRTVCYRLTMSVSVEHYVKALESLKEAMKFAEGSDIARDAAIQRFKFTVDLAWKVTKKIMGTASSAPKTVIREMAQNAYIEDVELWLKAIDQRNLSSHTYNEEIAEEVFRFIGDFVPHAEKLKSKLLK
jgi:nucleotidyltransferase substrate binding protein (TIGR01987 family)